MLVTQCELKVLVAWQLTIVHELLCATCPIILLLPLGSITYHLQTGKEEISMLPIYIHDFSNKTFQ